MWQGHVVSLHIAPEASAQMETVIEVRAVPAAGSRETGTSRATVFTPGGRARAGAR